jgi:hypothetical protein
MRKPIKKTFTFAPIPDAATATREYQTVLPAQGGLTCIECDEDADSVVLEFYELKSGTFFDAKILCKTHLDYHMENQNRVRECEESGESGERLDRCTSKKMKHEGYWKHQGKQDPED